MKTVLVLEDEPCVMTLFCRILKQYSLVEAVSAEQALQLFIEHGRKIDLLIADLILPEQSGIAVALLLRAEIPDLPVVLTSGHPVSDWNDRDTDDLKRLGPESVTILQKPFRAQILSDAVGNLVGTSPSWRAGTA